MTDEGILKNRLAELAQRALDRQTYTYTGFLSANEQALFARERKRLPLVDVALFGGCEGCERVVLRFGSPELCGYEEPFPIAAVRIVPTGGRFAGELTHRDFLGALMGLGITRAVLGDIVVREGGATLFCLEKNAPYIKDNLTCVKRDAVNCELTDAAVVGPLYMLTKKLIQAASERVDGVVSRVFALSRSESDELFDSKRVFINSALCESASKELREGDVVTARGFGRFRYDGVTGTTRKGKLNIEVSIYS